MKIDKIGLKLVKNMRRFEKKKSGSRSCTLWTTNNSSQDRDMNSTKKLFKDPSCLR